MRIIQKGDSRVIKIINKKTINQEGWYRFSLFTFTYADKNSYVIQNTLSFEVLELTKTEWDAIQIIQKEPVGYAFLMGHGLEKLALSGYIVETEHNDVKQYQQVVFLIKTIYKPQNGYVTYNIFPTTGCNARCTYCFEEGFAVRTMTIDMADKLIEFICETRRDQTTKIRWFGGEPLVAKHIITHICSELQKRKIPYESSMVTNASLMTKELAHEARELWHLKKVQVSLDGVKEDYTLRKQYYHPEKHNYNVVMQAIHALADEGIKVALRVNFDEENFSRLQGFVDEIYRAFGDKPNVSIYLSMLCQAQKSEHCIQLYQKMFELNDYISSLGMLDDKHHRLVTSLKTNHCMADALDDCIVIQPDGVFNNCDFLPENHRYGNLIEGVTDRTLINAIRTVPQDDEQCTQCPFLPECTSFFKKECPFWFEKCYEYHCMKTEWALQQLLKGESNKKYDDNE